MYEICDTDSFVFICKDDYAESDASFELRAATFFASVKNSTVIKHVTTENRAGLIGAALSCADGGAYVNFSQLYELPYSFSPRNLTAGLPSEYAVAVISQYSISAFSEMARRCGLRTFWFGRPTKVRRLTVIYGNGQPLSVSSVFLKRIGAEALRCADIPTVRDALYAQNAEKLAISDVTQAFDSDYTAKAGNNLICACAISQSSFIGSAGSLIYAVAKLVSCGVSYQDAVSSVRINAKELDAGEILTCITGVYRARAELALLACGDGINDTEGEPLCAFAAARSPENEIGHKLSGNGKVYLLYPRMSEDGLPKFSDLRRLFAYVHELIASGKALSVRAVGISGLASCIRDMGNAEYEILDEHEKLAVCGSFVIESNEKIDGIELFSKNN